MARRRSRDASVLGGRLPRPLRRLVGAAVLAGTVRGVDALWRRVTGRPTPVDARSVEDGRRAQEPAVVRDRLLYALLLGAALRLARSAGLPKDTEDGQDGPAAT
jgi:hypothetical protein